MWSECVKVNFNAKKKAPNILNGALMILKIWDKDKEIEEQNIQSPKHDEQKYSYEYSAAKANEASEYFLLLSEEDKQLKPTKFH